MKPLSTVWHLFLVPDVSTAPITVENLKHVGEWYLGEKQDPVALRDGLRTADYLRWAGWICREEIINSNSDLQITDSRWVRSRVRLLAKNTVGDRIYSLDLFVAICGRNVMPLVCSHARSCNEPDMGAGREIEREPVEAAHRGSRWVPDRVRTAVRHNASNKP